MKNIASYLWSSLHIPHPLRLAIHYHPDLESNTAYCQHHNQFVSFLQADDNHPKQLRRNIHKQRERRNCNTEDCSLHHIESNDPFRMSKVSQVLCLQSDCGAVVESKRQQTRFHGRFWLLSIDHAMMPSKTSSNLLPPPSAIQTSIQVIHDFLETATHIFPHSWWSIV